MRGPSRYQKRRDRQRVPGHEQHFVAGAGLMLSGSDDEQCVHSDHDEGWKQDEQDQVFECDFQEEKR